MRETPSRKSSHAAKTVLLKTHAVGSVSTRKLPPGRTGHPCGAGRDELSVVTPVAGAVTAWKLSPPSVDTIILIVLPAIQTMYTSPFEETLISGENESPARLVPAIELAPTPIQVAPWSSVRAKRICEPSSQTA